MSPVGMDDEQLSVVEKETLGECFGSAEARFEYEKACRLRRVAKLVAGVVGLVVFGVGMYWLGRGGHSPHPDSPSGHDGGEHQALDAKPVGSPQAKVQVLAIVPQGSDCHSGIIKFLSDTAGNHPEKIRAEFTTMEQYGQDKLSAKVGSVCAAVLINGNSSFEVQCEGTKRTVSLVGTEPTHYTIADVGEALTAVFTTEYGAPEKPLYELPEGAKCSAQGACKQGADAGGPPGAAGAKTTELDILGDDLKLPGFREVKPGEAKPAP